MKMEHRLNEAKDLETLCNQEVHFLYAAHLVHFVHPLTPDVH